MKRVGIDIGSTTVKIAVLDDNNNILFSAYEPLYANIRATLRMLSLNMESIGKKDNIIMTGMVREVAAI